MQYLWINPVSAGMCEEDSLKRFLERHGLTRVECRGDWGRIVRERYEASLRAGVTLADARCPEAVRLLEEIQKEPENESGIENLKVAPIEPILLHCARELSTRPDLADGEKIITTPCQSLAVLGNSLGLENTRFIAWNRLAGGEVRVRAIEDSPIPPGYFAGICRKDGQAAKVESVSSPEKIRAYVESGSWKQADLLELLYCKDGCHHGDGAGNRSGISDLVFGPHGGCQCVCATVPGAGVDELFKNGENRGTVAGYFNQFPACHEGICDCVPVCLCAGNV